MKRVIFYFAFSCGLFKLSIAQPEAIQLSNSTRNVWGSEFADLDGDSLVDIVAWNSFAIFYSKALGGEEFLPVDEVMRIPSGFSGVFLILDVDADDDLDLIIALNEQLILLRCVAPLVYEQEVVMSTIGSYLTVTKIDLNDDLFPELVIVYFTRTDQSFQRQLTTPLFDLF